MRRILLVLTVAATMGAMVALTASGAVAQPQPLEEFCETVGGTITFGPPTCTWTETTDPVPAQHGFTRTTSQVYQITIMQLGQPPTAVGDPIPSCQNPAGRDVPLDNPNCTLPT